MENIGKEPSLVHGTIHGPGYSGGDGIGSSYTLPDQRFSDDFHVFAVEWEPQAIRFYVDDALYATRTPAELPAGKKWVYDHPFFVILNLAVGGDWPGYPDATTVFPKPCRWITCGSIVRRISGTDRTQVYFLQPMGRLSEPLFAHSDALSIHLIRALFLDDSTLNNQACNHQRQHPKRKDVVEDAYLRPQPLGELIG